MSAKLKEFLEILRACKTTKEEKELILKEKAAIRQSFQKNEHAFRPRNLVKLIFINLQGVDTDFGQVESINITCRGSFIEKKVGYLAMAIFLHEKSEMLMMATNRISMDLDHPNHFVRCLALSAFSSISDSEMARSISPKIRALITQTPTAQLPSAYIQSGFFNHNPGNVSSLLSTDDSHKILLVRKKALQAGLRVVKKCPDLAADYVPIIQAVLKEKDHGLLLSAIPLAEEVYLVLSQGFAGLDERLLGSRPVINSKLVAFQQSNGDQKDRKYIEDLHGAIPFMLEKVRSLISHIDPDYAIGGVNDPFLLIAIIRCVRSMLEAAEHYGVGIAPRLAQSVTDTIGFVIASVKSSKKTINAVLYELARLSLQFREENEQVACAFMILNQLIEVKDNSPNYKFVALNLIKNFKYLNSKTLEMLLPHTELILAILESDEDVSLKTLALQVLPHISSENNVFRVLDCFKGLLLKQSGRDTANSELYQAVVRNVFYLLENKMQKEPSKRVEESIKILLLIQQNLNEDNLSSLLNLIASNESLQRQALERLWGLVRDNWRAVGLFKFATYLFGEFSEVISLVRISGFSTDSVLDFYSSIATKITDNGCKSFLLNSTAKILAKHYSRLSIGGYLSVFESFKSDSDIEIQNRAFEYTILLASSDISDDQRKELFAAIPPFVGREKDTEAPIRSLNNFEDLLVLDSGTQKNPSSSLLPPKQRVNDDIYLLNLDSQTTSIVPQKQPDTKRGFPQKKVVLKDLELMLEANYLIDGPSFRGEIRVINQASQNLYNVVVQLMGLQNATIDFKSSKIGVLASGADQSFEFKANLLDPSKHEAKFKFSIRYFLSNADFSDDFREVKEGSFVLSTFEEPSQPVKPTLPKDDFDIFGDLNVNQTITNPVQSVPQKAKDPMDWEFF